MPTIQKKIENNVVKINWAKAGLGKRFDSEVAKDFGVPRRQVTKIRTRMDIPAYSKSKKAEKENLEDIANVAIAKSLRVPGGQPKDVPIAQQVAAAPLVASPGQPKKKTPKPKSKVLTNHIAIVLDRSGSIEHYRLTDKIISIYNNLIDEIAAKSKESDQITKVNLFTFANRVAHVVHNEDPARATKLTPRDYRPDGGTALFDGVGAAINYLKGLPNANDENTSFLVITITDGEENSSTTYPAAARNSGSCEALARLMREVQQTDRWSLIFQLPPNFKEKLVNQFGIPTDNVREWEQTERGAAEVSQTTNSGIGTYYAARTSGRMSVQNFFVTTDMSRVSAKEVKAKLDDISDHFKAYTVEREMPIKEFVEQKSRKPYVLGSTYYSLSKKEKIQPQKQVLLKEKFKTPIYGGDQARDLIGLPRGAHATVMPGNHANYDIFVQSTSVNRILPRGTVVLVDVTKLVDDPPTW